MMHSLLYIAGALACLLSSVTAQAGPNTLAAYNPNLRTQSQNQIDKSVVAGIVGNNPLVPVPSTDKTLFPKGFPADKHPVLVTTAYDNDIRMGKLEIDSLMGGQVLVPYVDKLKNGKTGFLYNVQSFIGGTNGKTLMGVIPAVVGTLEGTDLLLAQVTPDTAAYEPLGSGQFSSQVKQVIVPNPVSGPGVVPAAVDLLFSTATEEELLYTAHTFHALINQPQILNNGLCQRNTIYFNASFANPIMRTGTVTLYSGALPKSLAGVYKNQGGYSVNGEQLGNNPQGCKAAAADVDPKATH